MGKQTIRYFLAIVGLVAIFLALPRLGQAAPTFKLAAGETWVVVLPDGDPTPLPPTSLVGVGLAVPLTATVSWYTEGRIAVPRAVFHPAPSLVTGPTFRLSPGFILGVSGLYQYSPAYAGGESHHLIAASLVPIIPITKEISLSLVLGAGKTLGGLWSASLTPKITFNLPF